MKIYKQFINEISPFIGSLQLIDKKYPKVVPFISVATRFINKPGKLKNPKLRKVLRRLQGKTDILRYSASDLKMVQRYIDDNNLYTIDDVRQHFYPDKDGNDEWDEDEWEKSNWQIKNNNN
jgi:hypothetical protein